MQVAREVAIPPTFLEFEPFLCCLISEPNVGEFFGKPEASFELLPIYC